MASSGVHFCSKTRTVRFRMKRIGIQNVPSASVQRGVAEFMVRVARFRIKHIGKQNVLGGRVRVRVRVSSSVQFSAVQCSSIEV
jgi:hypothetical protein